jgi:outer membrane receptor protein involved in Fe transport
MVTFNAALVSEAIQVREGVETVAKRRDDNEASLLNARKRWAAVGDAVSAEQVRKAPDKDAAEVLKRVTGLTVADGKYVFVRGMNERYSSTEVDGVRLASPEQNKRVVPLDLVPAGLLENVVVQKTYTADRPGEFGGGDVQVKTKDFPGHRSWSFSLSQGFVEGVSFRNTQTYRATRADVLGFGAESRRIPDAVYDVAGNRPLVFSTNPELGFSKTTLAEVGRSFRDVWSPVSQRAIPNGGYSASYGDEFKLFGRPLGVIESWSLSRSFDDRREHSRFFASANELLYDYDIRRSKESVLLGGLSGLSYRLSPSHSLHVRGVYTNSADDEVRTYEGPDNNRIEPITQTSLVHRNTRLMYVQRNVLSGTVQGQHEFARLLKSRLDWKFTRSQARRLQPDRREVTYDRRYSYDGTGSLVSRWILGSTGNRQYGDLKDNGWGTTVSASTPFRLGAWGNGKITTGYDRQTKRRANFYRRFNLYPNSTRTRAVGPDSIFAPSAFDGTDGSAYVEEATLSEDNYEARQRVEAGYVMADVPLGARVRANLGVRFENGFQNVRSYDLFDRSRVSEGRLDNQDVLPSGNVTWAVTDAINLRLAASRTVSRPDLNELSPSPATQEYVGGYESAGNPGLERARIDNYDVRVEAFPGLSEVLAAGFFHKELHDPIEQVIQLAAGSAGMLRPENSAYGRNRGVELEARAPLRRLSRRLSGVSINANATFISSTVRLRPQLSEHGSSEHPLQGQSAYSANAALNYTSSSGRLDATVLFAATGRRLTALQLGPLGDIYEQPSASLDATLQFGLAGSRVKLGAKNLLDPSIEQRQGHLPVNEYRRGRSYSIAVSLGS